MGYYTFIKMEAYDASSGLEDALNYRLFPERIKEISDAMDSFHFPTKGSFDGKSLSDDGLFLGDCHWPSQTKDMLKLSLAFPDVLFVLRGVGDESMDSWDEYWHNGTAERNRAEIPPFDPSGMAIVPVKD